MSKKPKQTWQEKFLAGRQKGRNDAWIDSWSLIHFLTGVVLGYVMPPFLAASLMILYEPLEIFILSPFAARFKINFGYEALPNSLSDIVFGIAGVTVGYYGLFSIATPPFHLF